MLTIEQLRTIARTVSPIALDVYDRSPSAEILGLIAQITPRNGNSKTFRLEWWHAFPELRQWMDKKSIQKAFSDALEGDILPYEITMAFDRWLATFDDALISAQDLAPKLGEAYALGKVLTVFGPIRNNELTYDGQNMFDSDHVHPDGSTTTNIVTRSRSSTGVATMAEAAAELKLAIRKLQANSLIRNSLTMAPSEGDLVVICKKDEVWDGYYSLLTEEAFPTSGDLNRFRGRFKLLRDHAPVSGTEKHVDVIRAEPGGPRPVVLVPHQEPSGVQFDTSGEFMNREIPFGIEGSFGFKAAFWQPVVQVRES